MSPGARLRVEHPPTAGCHHSNTACPTLGPCGHKAPGGIRALHLKHEATQQNIPEEAGPGFGELSIPGHPSLQQERASPEGLNSFPRPNLSPTTNSFPVLDTQHLEGMDALVLLLPYLVLFPTQGGLAAVPLHLPTVPCMQIYIRQPINIGVGVSFFPQVYLCLFVMRQLRCACEITLICQITTAASPMGHTDQ